jgi:hypothetical protein
VCWTLALLPSVLVTGVNAQCIGNGVTSHCVGHCSYFSLCPSLQLLPTVILSCLGDGNISVFSLCMMNWIISFCVPLDSPCPVTEC